MIKNNFRCSLSTPVYTNLQVLDQAKSITIVIHEADDGFWKFFSKEDKMSSDEKVVLVSLEEILMIDPSVGDVAHLPEGSIATRRNQSDTWKITSNKPQSRSGKSADHDLKI